jgi:hypothetical protein
MGRRMITRPIWKCPCIKLVITYFRHLEKRHPYWPEEFEDTKGVIRIRKSKIDRQHNDQKKKEKRTNNDLQNTTYKTKDRATQVVIL